jgi:hypothetical protein
MITNDITYVAGTQKNPTQTALTAPAFVDTDRAHFPNGNRLETIPEWIESSPSNALDVDDAAYLQFTGHCRTVWATTLNSTYSGEFFLFGCAERLYVIANSVLHNITPLKTTGATTLGSNPVSTTNMSPIVTITHTAHGFVTGDRIKISGVTGTIGGITAATLNKEHIITVTTVDAYTINVGTDATSTATGGGAAAEVLGQIDAGTAMQQTAVGVGVGLAGVGLAGVDQPSDPSLFALPRIWSFGVRGNDIVMTCGDEDAGDGQKIYIWDGDIAIAPTVLTNAPTNAYFVMIVNNAVVALCEGEVQISGLADATQWGTVVGQVSREIPVQRVRAWTGGIPYGDKSALLFTDSEALLLNYTGVEPDIWEIIDLSPNAGLIAPNAASVVGKTAVWMNQTGWYRFDGNSVEEIPNPMNGEWWFDGITGSSYYHCFAMPDYDNNQVYFFAPRDGASECSDYNIHNLNTGSFTVGKLDRTAAQRVAFVRGAFYAANASDASNTGEIYRHFTNNPDLDMGFRAELAESFFQDGSGRFRVHEFMMDAVLDGDVEVQYYTREYPNGELITATPVTFTPATTHQTIVAAGRTRKIRFSTEKRFTLGACKEIIIPQGRR